MDFDFGEGRKPAYLTWAQQFQEGCMSITDSYHAIFTKTADAASNYHNSLDNVQKQSGNTYVSVGKEYLNYYQYVMPTYSFDAAALENPVTRQPDGRIVGFDEDSNKYFVLNRYWKFLYPQDYFVKGEEYKIFVLEMTTDGNNKRSFINLEKTVPTLFTNIRVSAVTYDFLNRLASPLQMPKEWFEITKSGVTSYTNKIAVQTALSQLRLTPDSTDAG